MNNNLICLVSWLSIFIISLIIFISFILITIFKPSWDKSKQIAKNLFITDETINNLFNVNNKIRHYLFISNTKYIGLVCLNFFSPFVELTIVINIFIYLNSSINILIICCSISFIRTVIGFFIIYYFLQTILNKKTNKTISTNEITYVDKYKLLELLPQQSKDDEFKVSDLLMDLYSDTFKYIFNYKTYFKLGINQNIKNYSLKQEEYNSFSKKHYNLCYSIAYTIIIKKHKIINKLLKYKLVDHKKKTLNKSELIEGLSNNIFLIASNYLNKIIEIQLLTISKESLIEKCFKKYREQI